MIKEIRHKKNNKTNDSLFDFVLIDTIMEQPFKLKINILEETKYFHEKLKNANINILNEIPNADWVPVDRWTRLVCVSKKFKDIFEDKLKGYFYPTDSENYFIFLLDNCIDGLDDEKTVIVNHKEKVYWYESIENETFKPEVENEYLFTLYQEPLTIFCTEKFEKLYRQNNLIGIQFYKDINFKRKYGSRFDSIRLKTYDDEGNCID